MSYDTEHDLPEEPLKLSLGALPLLALTFAFVSFKVFDILEWDWVWCFAPLWIPAGIALIVLLLVFVVSGIIWIWETMAREWRK